MCMQARTVDAWRVPLFVCMLFSQASLFASEDGFSGVSIYVGVQLAKATRAVGNCKVAGMLQGSCWHHSSTKVRSE
jgi:hypothetical protein